MTPKMHADKTITPDWHTTAFGALYPVLYAHRTVQAAAQEANFAVEQLVLSKADTVLDLCCGTGRHIVHLKDVCGQVYGLDFSEELLALGRSDYGLDKLLVRGDMRSLPFSESFDAVVNFFTSFGYFIHADENQSVLHEIARTLKPGGRFMLDYLNIDHLAENLVPESSRTQGEYLISESRWIDSTALRVNKCTQVISEGVMVFETGESVQLYTQEELVAMLHAAGLKAESFYGDFSGAPVSVENSRLIVCGRKE